MKIKTCCLLLIFFFFSRASYSQTPWVKQANILCNDVDSVKVSIDCKNATMEDVLEMLFSQTGNVGWGHSGNLLAQSNIRLSLKNVSLLYALKKALEQEKTKTVVLLDYNTLARIN